MPQQFGDRPPVKTDEELEHEKDKNKLMEMLEMYSVDLIVIAANSLEARKLKATIEKITEECKEKAALDDEDMRKSHEQRKEAFVIWGSTEVPKLFAISRYSFRLHKNTQQILKQAIALARFEQDPLAEVLNLWSPILAENQALALNLDPLQKLINQTRLADGLEQVNIQVVNDVGVDLNLLIEHEHLQSALQFVSGFGPRKAKRFLNQVKSIGKKLATRGEIYKQHLLG